MKNVNDFEAQALPHLKNLYRSALCVSTNEVEAQELVQDSYTRAYYYWHKEQVRPNCRIWLFKNLADVYFLKCTSSSGLSTENGNGNKTNGYLANPKKMNELWPSDFLEEDSLSGISVFDVKKAIGDLPKEFRLLVVFFLLENFSYKELVDITGLSLVNVKSNLFQGRQKIKENLWKIIRSGKGTKSLQAQSGGKKCVSDQSLR